MAIVEVSFVYLEAAPTRDTLSSSNPFHDGYPIELNPKDQIQEFSRQIMADYDVVDATVYQVGFRPDVQAHTTARAWVNSKCIAQDARKIH